MEQANTVEEYLKLLSRYNNYENIFYRGQSGEYDDITSSVSRNEGYTINESHIYRDAIKLGGDNFSNLETPIEHLSKMQHYGIPTRLVDFSGDALTALFFAVQKEDRNFHGNVYVYIQPEQEVHSKHIRLLALFATTDSLQTDEIRRLYQKHYSETITDSEILEFASQGAFIKYSNVLQKENVRLSCQKGTFAICGNEISGKKITKTILPLNSIIPTMIIRIPSEHKQAVKKELDERYNINDTVVYPEFTSVAGYLREKYKKQVLNLNGTYKILEEDDCSHVGAKRISIVAVLNCSLLIDEIKHIAILIIDQYKKENDVISVFIAKNDDAYIMRNWIISAQWINEALDPCYKPLVIGEIDKAGYIWRMEKSYSTLADYYDEFAFTEDKNLLALNIKTFTELQIHYKYLIRSFKRERLKDLESYTQKNAKEISNIFLQFGEYGYSRNNALNEYLDNFQQLALHLDNVVLWIRNERLNPQAKKYQITICLNDAKSNYKQIIKDLNYWKKFVGLSDIDISELAINSSKSKNYQYKQTIPLNPQGLDVCFDFNISVNPDDTVTVNGKTNLFDKASLLISIRDSDGFLFAQNKSFVENGLINFGKLGKPNFGLKKGRHSIEVTLSLPSTQDKDFISKAGIEYENLTGKYVYRNGIGPGVEYVEEFMI